MAFSSHVPIYLDPHNFQQHHEQGNGSENPNQQQLHHPHHVGAGGGPGGSGSTTRPSSMDDHRARLAKIHHQRPQAALKCPRCDSRNTKFCYYNNYSLSQPRHFCKACRRYWTNGGAQRTVPVGGGCRKNKKNKRSTTGSESLPEKQVGNYNSNSRNSAPQTVLLPTGNEITGHFPYQTPTHLPFMGSSSSSLQNLSQYGLGNIGLHFGDQLGETSSGGTQLQQFPFFDPRSSNVLYPFQSEGNIEESPSRVSLSHELAPVKMENNNIQYWGGNSWPNYLSGLNSSTTTHNHLL